MNRPPLDDLNLAADWLEHNEGDESAALYDVADWLRSEVRKFQRERALALLAKKHGCTKAKVRKGLDRQIDALGHGFVLHLLDSLGGK